MTCRHLVFGMIMSSGVECNHGFSQVGLRYSIDLPTTHFVYWRWPRKEVHPEYQDIRSRNPVSLGYSCCSRST